MKLSYFSSVVLIGLLSLSVGCKDAVQPEAPVVEPPAPPPAAPPAAPPMLPASLPPENIYLANADGSAITRLTQGTSPVWSPDGRKILFKRGSDIYVMNAGGSNETRLARATSGVWSPDGRKIAYWYVRDYSDSTPFRDDEMQIFVVNADGTNPTQLTRHVYGAVGAQWSPDGSRIAFVGVNNAGWWQGGGDSPEHLYVMNADGTGQTQFTRDVFYDFEPQWSPDGRKIAYVGWHDGVVGIFVMNADGTNPAELTRDPEYGEIITHRWSPDGSKIAFASERNSVLGIYAMDVDGSNPTQLTHHEMRPHRPSHLQWLREGNTIAFQAYTGEFTATLWILSVMGGAAKTVLTDAYQAAWSPDGARIAFVSRRAR